MNHELPDVQAGFRRDRGTRDQIVNISKKQESSRKTSTFTLLTVEAFDCVDKTICGTFFKIWVYQTTLLAL